MPFAAIRTDLEMIILSDSESDRERQISHDITYMWHLKYDTNELMKQIDSQTQKMNYGYQSGKARVGDKLGVED